MLKDNCLEPKTVSPEVGPENLYVKNGMENILLKDPKQ